MPTVNTATIRLYFNRHGELPWSIDKGPGTKELQFAEVRGVATIR